MASLLQKAIDLAVKAHRSGEDPPGEPYIIHPMRVMLRVSNTDDDKQNETLRCVAILHDTVERAGLTQKSLLAAGIPPKIIKAVMLLTHEKDVTYADYVVRLSKNELARVVKLADLLDNADLHHVTFRPGKTKDLPRVVRYAASYKFLSGQMTKKEYRTAMKDQE